MREELAGSAMARIKALTVSQPYAEAIVAGVKTIETRTWRTKYRGALAIHAGIAWWRQRELGQFRARLMAAEVARRIGLHEPVTAYPRGALVGMVWMVDCVAFTPHSWNLLRAAHRVALPWREGLYAWVLVDARRLARPVPWRGARGLFDIPADLDLSAAR